MMSLNRRSGAVTAVSVFAATAVLWCGCAKHQPRPMVTAVGLSPGNQCDPPGIPYYLPKPLLIVAKNVRHVDESKVGLTGPAPIPNGFDNQAAYADLKANVTVPNTGGEASTALQAANVNPAELSNAQPGMPLDQSIVPESMIFDETYSDGLQPDSFFTYQIVFVPDLSQKYGLQISGGAGEFRAAMNLVNGWMYTGMGPFYFKDSSSAQNAMASGVGAMYAGRGVADVVSSVGDLASAIGSLPVGEGADERSEREQAFADAVAAMAAVSRTAPKIHRQVLNFAEIYIYEPVLLPDQSTEWRMVAEHHFDRDYFEPIDTPEAAARRKQIMRQLLERVSRAGSGEGVGEDQAVGEGADEPAADSTARSVAPFFENIQRNLTRDFFGDGEPEESDVPLVQPLDPSAIDAATPPQPTPEPLPPVHREVPSVQVNVNSPVESDRSSAAGDGSGVVDWFRGLHHGSRGKRPTIRSSVGETKVIRP